MRGFVVVATALGALVLATSPAAASERRSYAGWSLVAVDVPSDAALDELLGLGVDPWLDHPRPGVVPVLASPSQRAVLAADGWTTHMLVDDVQSRLDAEHTRLQLRVPPQPGVDYFADFRELDEVHAQLDTMAASHPELASVVELGESIEGRPIRALVIAAGGADDRPTIFVTAGQHAREWISVTSSMYVADRFLANAEEAMYAEALAAVQLVIVPVVNPDGYEFTWTGDRLWRKNRRGGVGVDTNRNFGWGWGGEGASDVPEEENYRGTAAFSEPETQAVRDYVLAHPELVASLDLHSFGQLVLYPWGDVYELSPDDAELSATATAIATAMSAEGATYTPLQSVNLYPAAGNIIDWAYGDAGLHALTCELRPSDVDEFQDGFLLGPDQIAPVGEEALAGVWQLIAWATGDLPDPPDEGSSSGEGSSSSGSSSSDDGGSTSSVDSGTGSSSSSGTTVATTLATSDGTGDASSSGAAGEGEGGGCGCTQARDRSGAVTGLFGVLVLGGRRARARARVRARSSALRC